MKDVNGINKMSNPSSKKEPQRQKINVAHTWHVIQPGAVITQSNDIAYITAMTEAEYKSRFHPTKITPYLGPMGKLWSVSCEGLEKNDLVKMTLYGTLKS